jgi:hypothetical protein
MRITTDSRSNQLITLLACLLLFMGIGRIFSLVTHNPVLGYANNYDMIRLQACHQIWPSDRIVNITAGTPAAPLRRYTLDKHVDTPCFPSSELLFTSIGIEAGKLKNLVTGEVLISIKTIGLVKAIFLAMTAMLISLYFYKRKMYAALLANGLIVGIALSDPGITLYLNTFYTEFSAVYFLYLALFGIIVLAAGRWHIASSIPLLLGLLGLGLSKPLHMPLALCIGILLAVYSVIQHEWKTAPALLLCAFMPILLQASGHFEPRNDSMIRVNKVNLAGSMLGISNEPERLLTDLGLPDTCKAIAGKNGYDQDIQRNNVCPELNKTSNLTFTFAFIKNPSLMAKFIKAALQQQKNWVFDLYGQVEHGRFDLVNRYKHTIIDAIRALPDAVLYWLAIFSILLPILASVKDKLSDGEISGVGSYLLLLVFLQWTIVGSAILESGMMGLGKNIHLYMPLVLAEATVLLVWAAVKYVADKE